MTNMMLANAIAKLRYAGDWFNTVSGDVRCDVVALRRAGPHGFQTIARWYINGRQVRKIDAERHLAKVAR